MDVFVGIFDPGGMLANRLTEEFGEEVETEICAERLDERYQYVLVCFHLFLDDMETHFSQRVATAVWVRNFYERVVEDLDDSLVVVGDHLIDLVAAVDVFFRLLLATMSASLWSHVVNAFPASKDLGKGLMVCVVVFYAVGVKQIVVLNKIATRLNASEASHPFVARLLTAILGDEAFDQSLELLRELGDVNVIAASKSMAEAKGVQDLTRVRVRFERSTEQVCAHGNGPEANVSISKRRILTCCR